MIFIVVKFRTKPEYAAQWPDIVADFTAATRAEPGNLWFEWSRSLTNDCDYVLVEGFRDEQAGKDHVTSAHFRAAMHDLVPALAETPRIISQTIPADDWAFLAEMTVPHDPHNPVSP